MLPLDYLTHGDPATVAAFLGVSRRTVDRYRRDPARIPPPVEKLLRLRLEGDLRALGGDAWAGFYFGRDGLLYVPGWRRGWTPHELMALFFERQELAALRVEVKRHRQTTPGQDADRLTGRPLLRLVKS